MGLGALVLGSLFLNIKGMRTIMFQLYGFYYKPIATSTPDARMHDQIPVFAKRHGSDLGLGFRA